MHTNRFRIRGWLVEAPEFGSSRAKRGIRNRERPDRSDRKFCEAAPEDIFSVLCIYRGGPDANLKTYVCVVNVCRKRHP